MEKKKMIKFKILEINRHRMNIDGKGVNTLVGLSNCPLSCKYCLNKNYIKENKFREMTPSELLNEVIIDYCYFFATGGGITFGGGEPLLQYKAIKEFSKILPKDIPINIETSLNIPLKNLIEIIDDVNYFMIDIKSLDEEIYLNYTKKKIDNVLKNLEYIKSKNLQDKCLVRIPTIPNYTSEESIKKTINTLKILNFNNLDIFKYEIF